MREIVLHPGTSIEVDGVRVRAASPANSGSAINPERIVVPLSTNGKALLKEAIASWLSTGDLAQAHLLTGAAREVAKLLSTCEARPNLTADEEEALSSQIPAPGRRV